MVGWSIAVLGNIVALFAAAAHLLALLIADSKQRALNYILLTMTVMIVNFGYLALAVSESLGEALLANRLTHLDGPFLTFFVMLCVFQLCKIKFPRWGIVLCMTASSLMYAIMYTAGYNDWYYSEVRFARKYGASHLVTEHGPAHAAYMILLAVYFLVTLGVIVYAGFHQTQVSHYQTVVLFLAEVLCFLIYVFESKIGLQLELLPMAYVIVEGVILSRRRRGARYDVSEGAEYVPDTQMQNAYVSFDAKKRYAGANENAYTYYPELRDLKLDCMIPREEKRLYAELVSILDRVEQEPQEPVRRRNGDAFLKYTVYPIVARRGAKSAGYIVEIVDETETQRQIDLLGRLNMDLKAMALDANQANNAKSDFLANVSHEIRTPINAVLGMNEMILRECQDAHVLQYAENIRVAGNALLSQINDVLDFSKIENRKMEIVSVDYDLGELLTELVELLRPSILQKNLELKLEIAPDTPSHLRGDDVRIRQIITNLMTNAIKYTKEGTITLQVFGRRLGDREAMIHVEVRDTGIGIKEEDLKVLCTSFQRLDAEQNRGIEGTGLGLAITMQLLEMMNSQLQVSSVYGAGSSFRFNLRQEMRDRNDIGVFRVDSKRRNGMGAHHLSFHAPSAKILVVDDSDINLKVFSVLLKNTGIQITEADSGKQCLKLMEEQKFDLIFLDHRMPEMDGVEVLHRARGLEHNRSRDAKMIALTANAATGAREEYVRIGFDDYLTKPIIASRLEAMIIKHLPREMVILSREYADEDPEQNEHMRPETENSFAEKHSDREEISNAENGLPIFDPKEDSPDGEENAAEENAAEENAAEKNAAEKKYPKATESVRFLERLKSLAVREKREENPLLVIDYDKGILYNAGSEEFYREILQNILEEHFSADIERLFREKNWEEYGVKVHGLKSTLAMIGAANLSNVALTLEANVKKETWSVVNNLHQILLRNFAELEKKIEQYIATGERV